MEKTLEQQFVKASYWPLLVPAEVNAGVATQLAHTIFERYSDVGRRQKRN